MNIPLNPQGPVTHLAEPAQVRCLFPSLKPFKCGLDFHIHALLSTRALDQMTS